MQQWITLYTTEANSFAHALVVDLARFLWGNASSGLLELDWKSGQWHHFRDCYKIIQYTQHSVSSYTVCGLQEFSSSQQRLTAAGVNSCMGGLTEVRPVIAMAILHGCFEWTIDYVSVWCAHLHVFVVHCQVVAFKLKYILRPEAGFSYIVHNYLASAFDIRKCLSVSVWFLELLNTADESLDNH